jgi:apolipoprotein N-acyltransferase
LAALVAAGLLAASFQPLNFGPVLAWIALLPLLYALRGQCGWRAFALGWLFGCAVNLTICAALLPIPTLHFHQVLIICAYLAFYPAAWGWLICAWPARSSTFTCVASALWVILEYLKAHAGFLSFPVGTLAQTQVDSPWLLQTAALFGEAGISFLVVWGNLVLWRALCGASIVTTGASALLIMLAFAFGALTLVRGQRLEAPRLQVAALHTQFDAFGPGRSEPAARMDRTFNYIATNLPRAARLLVLPETSFVNLGANAARLAALQAEVDLRHVTLIVGVAQALKFDRPQGLALSQESKVRAGAWIFEGGSTLPRRYDKVHRLAFAEYLPLAQWIAWPTWLVKPPLEVIEATAAPVYPTIAGPPVGIMVCWESVFSGHARELARRGATVLVQMSNEGWFSHTAAGLKHNATVRLRAVETRRPVIVASNAGPAIIVDAYGAVVTQRSSTQPEEWVTATIEPRSALTLYSRIGDVFVAACALAILAAWLLRQRPGRRRP